PSGPSSSTSTLLPLPPLSAVIRTSIDSARAVSRARQSQRPELSTSLIPCCATALRQSCSRRRFAAKPFHRYLPPNTAGRRPNFNHNMSASAPPAGRLLVRHLRRRFRLGRRQGQLAGLGLRKGQLAGFGRQGELAGFDSGERELAGRGTAETGLDLGDRLARGPEELAVEPGAFG